MSQTLNDQFQTCYSPRIAAFAAEVAGVDATGMPEPHLPFYGINYEQATPRLVVVGRDTKYWHSMGDFLQTATSDPATALKRHRVDFNEFKFTTWNYQFGRTFWATLLKLLAGFHSIEDWKALRRREHPDVLRSFVWAQTNSVEHFDSTPQEQGVDQQNWAKFKAAAERHFDSLSLLLDTFQPQVTVLLSRDVRPEYWDRRLSWQPVTEQLQCARGEVGCGGLIFHTAHPGWLSRKGLYESTLTAILELWRAEA